MALPAYTTSPAATLSSVLAHEALFQRSRDAVTLLAGSGAVRSISLGQVLGRVTLGAITTTAGGSNVGTGTVTGAARGSATKVGAYVLTCVAEAAGAGTFQVVDPDGYRLPDATVGVAYSHAQIAFTIGDGSEDWDKGDTLTLTVAAGSGKLVPLDLTATDGSHLAHAVAGEAVTVPDGSDAESWAILREAVLIAEGLVWPSGITDGQKTAALARLGAAGILTRTGV